MSDRAINSFIEAKKTHFNGVWGDVLKIVQGLIAEGEMSLPRVLRRTESRWRRMTLETATGTSLGEQVRMPRAALLGARQSLTVETLIDCCQQDTDLIVELGSGWGLNILDVFVRGGPSDALYAAMELSELGRKTSDTLASLEPRLRYSSSYFNYFSPDYKSLPAGNRHVLLFSSHSIEQVPHLDEAVIKGALALGDSVTGVHFEPVGWQIHEETGGASAVGASKSKSIANRYNENFWPLLRSLEKSGHIEITHIAPDIIGHKTKNASSLIIWKKLGGKSHSTKVISPTPAGSTP